MKTSAIISFGLASLALSAVNASAASQERWPRWYVGISGSLPYVQDSDLSGGGASDLDYDLGWGLSGQIGYLPNFAGSGLNGLRFEFEGAYRRNDLDSVKVSGVSGSAGGDITSAAYMVNMYYDVETGSQWKPYLGGGLGWSEVSLDTAGALLTVDDEDNVFAYQFMAGLGYVPTSIPLTEWTLGYRFFATEDPSFTNNAGVKIDSEYYTHNVELGAKFRF